MNKLFTSIAVASLSLTMAVGVGVAVSQSAKQDATQVKADSAFYTLDGTISGGTNGYATESEITQAAIDWKVTGNTEQTPWRIGGKSLSSVDRPIYSTTSMSQNVTQIVLSHGTASSITVNSLTLVVSANSDFSSPTSTLTGTFTASNTTTFTRPTGIDWSNMYYKFIYNVTVSGTSNKFVQFNSATFYSAAAVSYTITYDSNGGTGTMPDSTGAPAIVSACTFTAPTGMEFKEWNTSADGTGTSYAVGASSSADLDLFAIWYDPHAFYRFTGSTLTFANQGLENGVKYTDEAFASEVFSMTFSGGNSGTYYETGSGIRTYKNGGSFTITAVSGTITSISFVWSGSYKPTSTNSSISSGEMSSDYATWTGSSSSVTLTYTSNENNDDPWRLQALTVTTANVMEIMDTSYNVSSSFEVIKTTGELVLYGHDTTAPAQTVLSGLSWSTQDTSIISIDGATNYCTVTGLAVGNATLTMSKSGYADVDVTITVTGGAIEMIVVEGTLTQSEYEVGDSWSHAGLTVTGLYESGDEVDLTNDSRIEWEYYANGSLSTSAALGNTSLVARAIFDELYDDSTAKSITVSEHQASGPIPSGRYYIMDSSKTLGLDAAAASSTPLVVDLTTSNTLKAFDVELVGDNEYEISTTIDSTKYYLVCDTVATSKNNDKIRITSTPNSNLESLHWSLSSDGVVETGAYHVSENTIDSTYRYLSCYNSADWRGYLNTNNGDPEIQFVAEKSYAEGVADKILESCTSRGSSSYDTTAWGNASTAYAAITIEAEKNFLINGSAVKDSTVKLERALEQYDYAVSRYEGIDAFITGRTGIYGLANNASLFAGISTEATTAIIVVVALTSVTAIGAIFFIKRRKYN